MTDKFTDKEIIKALECCITTNNKHKCIDCPYENVIGFCFDELNKDALALINRQQAEIERLKEEKTKFDYTILYDIEQVNKIVKKAEAEAIKEFAERLKDYQDIEGYDAFLDKDIYSSHIKIEIDELYNLVKEMVGEQG